MKSFIQQQYNKENNQNLIRESFAPDSKNQLDNKQNLQELVENNILSARFNNFNSNNHSQRSFNTTERILQNHINTVVKIDQDNEDIELQKLTFQLQNDQEECTVNMSSTQKQKYQNIEQYLLEDIQDNDLIDMREFNNLIKDKKNFNENDYLSEQRNIQCSDESMRYMYLLLQHEKNKLQSYEEKLRKKEKMIQQMRTFHNTLYQTIEDNQEEKLKLKQENEIYVKELKDQLDNYKKKEKNVIFLQTENNQLKLQLMNKDAEIQQTQQNLQFQDQELKQIQKQIEEQNRIIQSLCAGREEQIIKNEKNNNKINKSLLHCDESTISIFPDEKSTIEHKQFFSKKYTIDHDTDEECEFNVTKDIIDKQKDRSSSFTMGSIEIISPTESRSIMKKIYKKLEVTNEKNLYQKIKKMQNQSIFIESLYEIISKMVPQGYLQQGKSPLKQSWKFIRKVLEKYCIMKKKIIQLQANQDILDNISQYLSCNDSTEILPKIVQLILDSEIYFKIEEKIKQIFNLEWVKSLNELNQALEIGNTERFNL